MKAPVLRQLGEFADIIRLKCWRHDVGLTGLGILYAAKQCGGFVIWKAMAGLLVATLYLAHGHAVNDFFDYKFAQQKEVRHPLRNIAAVALLMLMCNCLLSFCLNPSILWLVLAGGAMGFFYVAPPFRLKNDIVANCFINSLGFALLFLIGFGSIAGHLTVPSMLMAAYFFLFFIPLQILHHIAHAEKDLEMGTQNIYNRCGPRLAIKAFNLSLIGLVLATVNLQLSIVGKIVFMLATLLFSLFAFLEVQRRDKCEGIDPASGAALRVYVRKIAILYGVGLGVAVLL